MCVPLCHNANARAFRPPVVGWKLLNASEDFGKLMVRSLDELNNLEDQLCKLQNDMVIHALNVPHTTAKGRFCSAQFRSDEFKAALEDSRSASDPVSKKKARRRLRCDKRKRNWMVKKQECSKILRV